MRRVYKYTIPVADDFVLQIPRDAYSLTVQVQRGTPCIWALVDPQNEPVPRRFRLAGTGRDIEEALHKHIGTFQLHDGELVFHLFEVMS